MSYISTSFTLVSSLSGSHFSFSIPRGAKVDTFSSVMCSVSKKFSVSGFRNFSLGSLASITIRASCSSIFSSGGSVGLSPPAIPVIIPSGLLSSTVGFFFLCCRIVLFFGIVESIISTDILIVKLCVSSSTLSVRLNGLIKNSSSLFILLSRGLSSSLGFIGGSLSRAFHSGFMVSPLFLSVCSFFSSSFLSGFQGFGGFNSGCFGFGVSYLFLTFFSSSSISILLFLS